MQNDNLIKSSIKGAFLSVFLIMVCVMVFALVVYISALNDKVIKAVNQFIKVIAIFVGCTANVKENKGLIKGLFIGLLTGILIHLIFYVLSGASFIDGKTIIDVVFMSVIGSFCGIISVNLRK